jgi:hypothetical protein
MFGFVIELLILEKLVCLTIEPMKDLVPTYFRFIVWQLQFIDHRFNGSGCLSEKA